MVHLTLQKQSTLQYVLPGHKDNTSPHTVVHTRPANDLIQYILITAALPQIKNIYFDLVSVKKPCIVLSFLVFV